MYWYVTFWYKLYLKIEKSWYTFINYVTHASYLLQFLADIPCNINASFINRFNSYNVSTIQAYTCVSPLVTQFRLVHHNATTCWCTTLEHTVLTNLNLPIYIRSTFRYEATLLKDVQCKDILKYFYSVTIGNLGQITIVNLIMKLQVQKQQ